MRSLLGLLGTALLLPLATTGCKRNHSYTFDVAYGPEWAMDRANHDENQTPWDLYLGGEHELLGGGSPEGSARMVWGGAGTFTSPHSLASMTVGTPLLLGEELVVYRRPRDLAGLDDATLSTVERTFVIPRNFRSRAPRALRGVPENVARPWVQSFDFAPSGFAERRVRVLLPPGYNDRQRGGYPLLIALDGQNVFSPGGPFGSWDLDLISDQMIRAGEVPPFIIVAIDNTPDRFAEYIPGGLEAGGVAGRGDEFLTAINNELLPMLRERLPIAPGTGSVALIGASLGGLIGVEGALRQDFGIGTYIAMSPSLWVAAEGHYHTGNRILQSSRRLWIDSGTTGQGNDSYAAVNALRDALLRDDRQFNPHLGSHFMHVTGEGQGHNEAAWRERSPMALRWWLEPLR